MTIQHNHSKSHCIIENKWNSLTISADLLVVGVIISTFSYWGITWWGTVSVSGLVQFFITVFIAENN